MDEEQNEQVEQVSTTTAENQRKGFNITSMVLGIISIVTMCWSWYLSLPSAIIAIIFSIAGRHDAGRGMGIAGLVLGIISLVLLVLIIVLAVFGIAFLSTSGILNEALNATYPY